MSAIFKQLWFRNPKESSPYINDIAVRIRAGILLIIPLYLGLVLYDVSYTYRWVVDEASIHDTYETNWDGQIIYSAEVLRRTYDYTVQTWVLFYALFEMLVSLFVFTSRLSPTILISSLLAKRMPPVYKPLVVKRFAWVIGASLITVCLVFFNPDTVATWVNAIFATPLLPTDENFLPKDTGIVMVWICLSLMWLEAILGFCVGCQVHHLLVRLGIVDKPCDICRSE